MVIRKQAGNILNGCCTASRNLMFHVLALKTHEYIKFLLFVPIATNSPTDFHCISIVRSGAKVLVQSCLRCFLEISQVVLQSSSVQRQCGDAFISTASVDKGKTLLPKAIEPALILYLGNSVHCFLRELAKKRF